MVKSGATTGNVAIVKTDDEFSIWSPLAVFRSNVHKILPEYLHFFLQSYPFRKGVELNWSFGTQQNIGMGVLSCLPIAYPSLAEQTAIANFLDRKTAQIDQAISIKEKQIELLKERRQILIHNTVTRGLDPDVKMKGSGVEWIGEIPEHWGVKKIKYLGKILNGYAFASSEFVDTGVRVMKISNIQTMMVDWTDESFVDEKYYQTHSQFMISMGDLVFALTRPIISTGIKAAIVQSDEKILLNQRNAVLKPYKNLQMNWIYYILLDANFVQAFEREIDITGQQPNISTNSIANLEIPYPSFPEQLEICRHIEQNTKKIATAISLKQKEIEKLKEYKSTLINSAVTGKIKVSKL